jgi:hypothetical protein
MQSFATLAIVALLTLVPAADAHAHLFLQMAGLDMINKKIALPPGVHGAFFSATYRSIPGGNGPITRGAGHFW